MINLPPYTERIKIMHRFYNSRQRLAIELYTQGGRHPKDLAVAEAYELMSAMLESIFPECYD